MEIVKVDQSKPFTLGDLDLDDLDGSDALSFNSEESMEGIIAPGATEEDCIMCCCCKDLLHDETIKFTLRYQEENILS